MKSISTLVLLALVHFCDAFRYANTGIRMVNGRRMNFLLRDQGTHVALELTGQFDPSKSWDVKLIFNG